MDRDFLFESQFATASRITPHFDDERTLLAARRVVPLGQVAKVSYLKRLRLVSAFAVAILLGASVALLTVYLRQGNRLQQGNSLQQGNLEAITGVVHPETPSTATAETPLPVAEETPSILNTDLDTVADSEDEVAKKRSQVVQKQAPRLRQATNPAGHTTSSQIHRNQRQTVEQPRLVEQWEERRLRRAMRRERRLRGDYPSRDLFHVEEIFEGSRRP